MKTSGQILADARRKKGISIAQIAKKTKIDEKYVKAVEADDYASLPSATFIKGFIRNLALALEKDPQAMVAIFRRDYREEVKTEPKMEIKLGRGWWRGRTVAIVGIILMFFGYLLFQYRMVLRPPKLVVEQPKNGVVAVSPVKVEGISELGINIVVNGRTVKPDLNGYFSYQLEMEPGEKKIVVEAISRFGKSSRKEIDLVVISRD